MEDDQVYLVDNGTLGIQAAVVAPEKWEIQAYSGWNGPIGERHVLGGDVLAVPKGAPNSDLAIKLMELLVSKEVQQDMRDALTWMPVRVDAFEDADPALSPYFDAVRDAFVGAEIRPTVPLTLWEDSVRFGLGRICRRRRGADQRHVVWLSDDASAEAMASGSPGTIRAIKR